MSLIETIDQDIKKAMLAKQEAQLRSLRAVKAALLVAKTEKGASDVMTQDAEIKVLQRLVKQRKESAEIYQAQNRPDLQQIEEEELGFIETYLPKQLDRADVEHIIKGIITSVGATSVKDMGKVMGAANKELAGKADGRTISEVVKQLLS
ncbi:GatB/YqeY domain-containing protein [Mucilaginibacter sp. HMF5004]|uniref:GatB/YqeY domain-containing protein n=1 Tax=Mucilaginibacter rivuli TaxID=2857527 RepID=UPI001C5DADD3|nr:GatB/YqeY domain-containing protein [Mucilaginibacter rivuli]MBW4889663.1 GatB/YqeY domain-containing protein [Mucilaginibacter rivuli]